MKKPIFHLRTTTFYVLLALVLGTPLAAQNEGEILSQNAASNAPIATFRKSPPADLGNEPLMQARRQLMSSLEAYSAGDMVPKGASGANATISDQDFANYVAKTQKDLQRRLAKLEEKKSTSMDYFLEKARLLKGLSLLKSATCLASNSDAPFAQMKDLEGNDIVAYSLEVLKNNVRYGFLEPYKEGFARIKKDQVYGFLNYCGDEVVVCQYETAEPFNNGKALVKKVNWYFVDVEGNESEQLQNVVSAKALRDGISIATLSNGKQALIDNYYDISQRLLSTQFDAIEPFGSANVYRVRLGKKYGVIALNGEQKLEIAYDRIDASNANGLYQIEQGGKMGFVDSSWVVKFKPGFQQISGFNEYGLALAKEQNGYRLINQKTMKSSKLYDAIGEFDGFGLTTIRSEVKRYGLIDSGLNVVLEPLYFSITPFNQFGLAAVCREENNKCGFINTEGREIIPTNFLKVGNFNGVGLVSVRTTFKDCPEVGKECKGDMVYDLHGKMVISAAREANPQDVVYEVTDTIHGEHFNAVTMRQGRSVSYHLVQKEELRLITTTPYETISPLDINGLFPVRKDGLWGLMDTSGRLTAKCSYREIRKPGDGYYGVRSAENGKLGFISPKGKVQVPFDYDEIRAFRGGHAVVQRGKLWGLINKFNAKIIPCAFKAINTQDDKYEVISDSDTFIVNTKGDCEQNCEKFDSIRKKANASNGGQ